MEKVPANLPKKTLPGTHLQTFVDQYKSVPVQIQQKTTISKVGSTSKLTRKI